MRVEETRSKAEPLSVLVTRESGFRIAPGPADIPEKGRWQEGAGYKGGEMCGRILPEPPARSLEQADGPCSSGKLFSISRREVGDRALQRCPGSVRRRSRRIGPVTRFIFSAHDYTLGIPAQVRSDDGGAIPQGQTAAPPTRLVGFGTMQQQVTVD
jgi:hypothetical protein